MIMPDDNRNKLNQPPTGEGKRQSPQPGQENRLNKRSEVVQAERNRPEGDYGAIAEEEGSSQGTD
jgi:hypothetical protein